MFRSGREVCDIPETVEIVMELILGIEIVLVSCPFA
jgi:hypothetical protein